jgi:hypothetical protein
MISIGCAAFPKKTPEYQAASDVSSRLQHLAVQVRGAERTSQIQSVREGSPFFANCVTYSLTAADLLVSDYGADPESVWLVRVRIPVRGFVWEHNETGWHRIKSEGHQIVVYRGLVIDNRWQGVLTPRELEWEYRWETMKNLKDDQWVAVDKQKWGL